MGAPERHCRRKGRNLDLPSISVSLHLNISYGRTLFLVSYAFSKPAKAQDRHEVSSGIEAGRRKGRGYS